MRCLISLVLFLTVTQASAQERRDSISGFALLMDVEQRNTAVVPAYAITRYIMIVDGKGSEAPKVLGVKYYRLEDCTEIPVRDLIIFKQR